MLFIALTITCKTQRNNTLLSNMANRRQKNSWKELTSPTEKDRVHTFEVDVQEAPGTEETTLYDHESVFLYGLVKEKKKVKRFFGKGAGGLKKIFNDGRRKAGKSTVNDAEFRGVEEDLQLRTITETISNEVSIGFNFCRCFRISLYHFLYPLSIPVVYFYEGFYLAHALQFLCCFNPKTRRLRSKAGCADYCRNLMPELALSQYFINPGMTLLIIVSLARNDFAELPCAGIVKANLLIALAYHFIRLIVVGIKYAMMNSTEFHLLCTRPFSETWLIWMQQHLVWWAGPPGDRLAGIRDVMQVAILREGLDVPRAGADKFSAKDGFYFSFTIEVNQRDVPKFAILKASPDLKKMGQETIHLLEDFEPSTVPRAIEEKVRDVFHSLRDKGDRSKKDFLAFRKAFAVAPDFFYGKKVSLATPRSGKCFVELRMEGRETCVASIHKYFDAGYLPYQRIIMKVLTVFQTLLPWAVALLSIDQSSTSTATESYNGMMRNGTTNKWSCELYKKGNFSKFGIDEQIKYSLSDSAAGNQIWLPWMYFITILSTINHGFCAFILFNWLFASIYDYRRRYVSMYAFDDLIKKRHMIVTEKFEEFQTSRSLHENPSFNDNAKGYKKVGFRAKRVAPVLLLDSPSNVLAFIKARKILKKIGYVYHYRIQILTAVLFSSMALLLYFAVREIISGGPNCAGELDRVMISAIACFIVFGGAAILEIIHQGGLANYQVSRCAQFLATQETYLAQIYEDNPDNEALEVTITAIEAAQAEIETEWTRQPVRILGMRAGATAFRVFSLFLTAVFSFVQSRRNDC